MFKRFMVVCFLLNVIEKQDAILVSAHKNGFNSISTFSPGLLFSIRRCCVKLSDIMQNLSITVYFPDGLFYDGLYLVFLNHIYHFCLYYICSQLKVYANKKYFSTSTYLKLFWLLFNVIYFYI